MWSLYFPAKAKREDDAREEAQRREEFERSILGE
jgi:hypothetical protein